VGVGLSFDCFFTVFSHPDPPPAAKQNHSARVFVLGPSHHVYGRRCWLSPAAEYDTPFGPLVIDQAVYADLRATGAFDEMTNEQDEAEHSLELHLPFIARAMGAQPFTLVPIMVGALTPEAEARYAALLAPYIDDPSNFFVVSSDFCHWGRRFGYTYYDKSRGAIWECIQWLDELGMAIIERPPRGGGGSGNNGSGSGVNGGSGSGVNGGGTSDNNGSSGSGGGAGENSSNGDGETAAAAFTAYLKQYRNTICGRHPIGVLLAMLAAARTDFGVKFSAYDQSSRCEGPADSSVSYAAALVTAVGAGTGAA
jgi:predicted class III extradiol MEMO1 family dioxygenase